MKDLKQGMFWNRVDQGFGLDRKTMHGQSEDEDSDNPYSSKGIVEDDDSEGEQEASLDSLYTEEDHNSFIPYTKELVKKLKECLMSD